MENSILVSDLYEKCRVLAEKRKKYEEAKAVASELNSEYMAAEKDLVEIMIAHEMYNLDSPSGKFSLKRKEYYPVPKTSEDKEQIRKYMEDKGIFENYWSIHSQSFNSWVKQEAEIAKQEGKIFDIPGVELPTISYDLAMRKK